LGRAKRNGSIKSKASKVPLVLLHGWTCGPEDFGSQVAAFRSERETSAPAWGELIDVHLDPATAFRQVIDQLADCLPRGAAIAGHSMGSVPATMLATRPEVACRGLLLLDGGVVLRADLRANLTEFAESLRPCFESRDEPGLREIVLPAMRTLFEGFFPESGSGPARRAVMDRLEQANPTMAASQILGALSLPAEEALRAVRAPVVAIAPEQGRMDIDLLGQVCPEVRVETVADAGHFFMLTRPEATCRALEKALAWIDVADPPDEFT
jgi:pimeloyl-ACP methyl ester carboxylesterase